MSTIGNEGLSWGALTQGLSQPQGGMPPWLQAILEGLAQQQPQPVPQIQTPVPGMEGGGALPSLGGPTPPSTQPTQPLDPRALGQGRREVTQAGGGFPGVFGAPPTPMLMAAAGMGGEEEKRNIGPFDASRVNEFLQQNQGGGPLDFLGGYGRTIGSLMPNMFAAGVARNMLGPTAETPTAPIEPLISRPREADVRELGPVGGPQGIATRQGAPTPTGALAPSTAQGLRGGAGSYERALGVLEEGPFTTAAEPVMPEHEPPVKLDLALFNALRARAEEAEPEAPTPESKWQKIVRTGLQIGLGAAAGNNWWQALAGGAMTGGAGWLKSTKEWDRMQTQYQTALGKHGVDMAKLDLEIGKAQQAQEQAQVDWGNQEEDLRYKIASDAYTRDIERQKEIRGVRGKQAEVLTAAGRGADYRAVTQANIASSEKIAGLRQSSANWRALQTAQGKGDPLERIERLHKLVKAGGEGTQVARSMLREIFLDLGPEEAVWTLAEFYARSPRLIYSKEQLDKAEGEVPLRIKQNLENRGMTTSDPNWSQAYTDLMSTEIWSMLSRDRTVLKKLADKGDPIAQFVWETYYAPRGR